MSDDNALCGKCCLDYTSQEHLSSVLSEGVGIRVNRNTMAVGMQQREESVNISAIFCCEFSKDQLMTQ